MNYTLKRLTGVCREQVLCSVTHFRITKPHFPFYNSKEALCSSIATKVTPI